MRAVTLAEGEVLRLEGPGAVEVACESGRVWITEEAQWLDTWLVEGGRTRLGGRGTVVMEARSPSRVRLTPSPRK